MSRGPECRSLKTVGKIGFILGEMGVTDFLNFTKYFMRIVLVAEWRMEYGEH